MGLVWTDVSDDESIAEEKQIHFAEIVHLKNYTATETGERGHMYQCEKKPLWLQS